MKKLILFATVMVGLFFAKPAVAQVRVNINISVQPEWGPSGYDYAKYYFIPEINAYYDIASKLYVYREGSRWMKKASLPPRCRDFDLYKAYKVVINDQSPWKRHNDYQKKYSEFANQHDKQVPLRDARNKQGNPKHGKSDDHHRHEGEGPGR
jgi:hypothetical protein